MEIVRVRLTHAFGLVGYVIMPNHVHLLLSEPAVGTISTVLQMLKQRVSRQIRCTGRQLSAEGSQLIADLPGFWQPRFYDFNVYSREKKNEKLHYMHANPVIRGLVKNPRDWLWSSFSFCANGEQGPISVDAVNF
jgi:putative transposase